MVLGSNEGIVLNITRKNGCAFIVLGSFCYVQKHGLDPIIQNFIKIQRNSQSLLLQERLNLCFGY